MPREIDIDNGYDLIIQNAIQEIDARLVEKIKKLAENGELTSAKMKEENEQATRKMEILKNALDKKLRGM